MENRTGAIENEGGIAANQLGRRNLTEMSRAYLIGVQYSQRKMAQGGTGANQHTKSQSYQSDNFASGDNSEFSGKTAEIIAGEQNVGTMTVIRNESFAQSVDKLLSEKAKRERASKGGKTGGKNHPKDNNLSLSVAPFDKLSADKPKTDTRKDVAKEAGALSDPTVTTLKPL